jgi:REP element-mobilizing transposase RayT
MTCARNSLISLRDTPYYHVVARCVRRAWLWGFDEYAGKDYSHRKVWVLERLKFLSAMYAIDICAYAVMSNHYHLVLRVDQQRARAWTYDEVVERWTKVFSRPPLVERLQQKQGSQADQKAAIAIVELWRTRLCDISWYMRCLNEYLARRANSEDRCKGRFWEGRFKSQALLDEAGLMTAMVYVDLNPVRAGIADTPESSDFTSIYTRIQTLRLGTQGKAKTVASGVDVPLLAMRNTPSKSSPVIPCRLSDYIELVDWSGRSRRQGKRGSIDAKLPAIFARLHIDPEEWRLAMQTGGQTFGRAVGRIERLRLHAQALGQSWIRGFKQSQRLYS